jgi:4-hydroxy-tetrahydrodipicolinate synthase
MQTFEKGGWMDNQASNPGGKGFKRRSFITGGLLTAGALPEFVSAALGDPRPIPSAAPTPGVAKSHPHEMLCGPMIPVVTHYNRDLSLDLGAFKETLQYLMEHGIRNGNGCFLVGGAGGDFPMLSVSERTTLARTAAEVCGKRAPIVLCAQATDERVTLELAQVADDIEAYAIQVSPPYYYHPSDEDVLRLFRKVDSGLKQCGIMVYNTYWEGYNLPFELIDQLVDLDHVVSLKYATPGGGSDFMAGVARYGGKIAVIDNAGMWPVTSMLGGSGFITHLATVWPEHELQIYALTQAGEYKKAMESMRATNWLWEQFRGRIAHETSGEAPVVKCALELCGRPGGPARPPSRALNEEERADLRKVLAKIGAPVV